MIERESFSALPHEVIRDTRISRDARLLYAVLQMYWWQGGECWETHATLAADLGCGVRQLQRYLDELIEGGLITERRRGHGQQKAYAPVLTRQGCRVEPVKDDVSEHDASDGLATNTTPLSDQHDIHDVSNTTPVSDRGRHPEDREREPILPGQGDGATSAAPPPAPVEKPSVKRTRRTKRQPANETPVPETIELTEQSYQTASRWGFNREDVDFELERFLARAKRDGWTYTDWKGGFRTWLLNEVKYAREDGRPVGKSAAKRSVKPATSAPVRMKVY